MSWFYNLSVSRRLTFTFCLILAFLGGLMAFNLWNLRTSFRQANGMFENNLTPIAQLSQGNTARLRMQNSVLSHVLTSDTNALSKIESDCKYFDGEFESPMAQFGKNQDSSAIKDNYGQLMSSYKAMQKIRDEEVLPASKAGKKDEAAVLIQTKLLPLDSIMNLTATKLADLNKEDAQATIREIQNSYKRTVLLTLAIGSVVVILSLLMGFLVGRSIAKPLAEFSQVLRATAGGDLRARSSLKTRDEFGTMARMLN